MPDTVLRAYHVEFYVIHLFFAFLGEDDILEVTYPIDVMKP